MSDIRTKVREIYSIEQLSAGRSPIHDVHPLAKILVTLTYLVCLVSAGPYDLTRTVLFLFYPVIVIALAAIPFRMILSRALVALPFCLLAGLSNLVFNQTEAFRIGTVGISLGLMSFVVIVLRTLLSVSAVLILVAVTPVAELTGQLRRMGLPDMIVTLFEMTYRYIGTLLGEAAGMFTAYQLRAASRRGLEMRDMGSFVGMLLLRSFDRADRVYNAMKCRGYPGQVRQEAARQLKLNDCVFLALAGGSALLFRLTDLIGTAARQLGGAI